MNHRDSFESQPLCHSWTGNVAAGVPSARPLTPSTLLRHLENELCARSQNRSLESNYKPGFHVGFPSHFSFETSCMKRSKTERLRKLSDTSECDGSIFSRGPISFPDTKHTVGGRPDFLPHETFRHTLRKVRSTSAATAAVRLRDFAHETLPTTETLGWRSGELDSPREGDGGLPARLADG